MLQMMDFVLGLLHQNVKPLTQISRNHVHQTKASYHLMTVHFKFFCVQKDELHLHDG